MRVAAVTGVRTAGLVETPDPVANGEFARVRVSVSPMCTEFRAFRDGYCTAGLGHEAAGEVADAAPGGHRRAGERVVVMPQNPCGGCELCLAGEYIHCERNVDVHALTGNVSGTATYAPWMLKTDRLLLPIPDDISTEHAAMACCGLGPTFGALETMAVAGPEWVIVGGLGPVGLGGVVNAVLRGARVIGIESQPYRAALAKKLGAEVVIDPNDPDAVAQIRSLTNGRGADAAIDCVGAASAQTLMLKALRRKGRIALVGLGGELTVHTWNDLISRGLTIYGQWHYNLGLAPKLMQTIRQAGPLIDTMVTHRFPMSRVQEAFELQLTGNCGKILLDPWG